jgi:Tol biopolymer transport system component
VWAIHPDGRRIDIMFDATGTVRWSPDGTQLAFAQEGQLHVISRTGLDDRLITTPPGNRNVAGDSAPAWLDAHTLVFVRAHQPDPSIADVTTAIETISLRSARPAQPLFAIPAGQEVEFPDASRIGAIAFNDGQSQMWAMSRRGRYQRQLAPGYPIGTNPRWSPDGKRVLFLANGQQPAIVDVATGRVRALVVGGDAYAADAVAWSPDGTRVAVAEDHAYDCNDPTADCSVGQLWILDLKTGAQHRVFTTTPDGEITSVDWTAR